MLRRWQSPAEVTSGPSSHTSARGGGGSRAIDNREAMAVHLRCTMVSKEQQGLGPPLVPPAMRGALLPVPNPLRCAVLCHTHEHRTPDCPRAQTSVALKPWAPPAMTVPLVVPTLPLWMSPLKALWDIVCVHMQQPAQSAEETWAHQQPTRPEVPFCHKEWDPKIPVDRPPTCAHTVAMQQHVTDHHHTVTTGLGLSTNY